MDITRRKPEGLVARVAESLREYVKNATEGTKLIAEPDLAKELGVSRTTLRSALAILQGEGLIDRAPRRGTVVRRPRSSRPTNIGVISPLKGWERSGSFYSEVYKGITSAAVSREVDITHLLGSLGRDITPGAIKGLTWERFDALVVFELFDERCAELFRERAREVVYLDYDATSQGITSIVFDNLGAAAALTEALMDMGHQRFAFIGPRLGGKGWKDPAYVERLRGVMDAVTRRGGIFLAQHILAVDKGDNSEVLKPVLDAPEVSRPTAIVAADRSYAALLLDARDKGLVKVPEEISLVAFESANTPAPEPMAGATFNGREMGFRGVQELHSQVREENDPGRLIKEGFSLCLEHTVVPRK